MHHTLFSPSDSTADISEKKSAALPARNEVDAAFQWKLNDIYADESVFADDCNKLRPLLDCLRNYKDKLGDPKALTACLRLRDAIGIKAGALLGYARMSRDTDAADARYQAMTAQIESLLADCAAAGAFIEPELLALPPQTLRRSLREEPELAEYRFYLEDLLRQGPHILSPAEEELLAKLSEALQTPATIYAMLTNADLEFPETPDESGRSIRLSEGRYNALIRSRDRAVRQSAFLNLFQTYAKYRNTFAAALGGSIKSTVVRARARRYGSALEAALDGGNIPVSVYDGVIDTVRAHLPCLHDYVALKKRLLGLDCLHMYDLYVPLAKQPQGDYPYAEGLCLVGESLRPLGDRYVADLRRGAADGWIDIYENRGKRTGAYSWGVFGVHPFVLLNYDDRYGSVSTLAHELGHAMHSYYSNQTQPYSSASYTIFCAEVASTVNEILLLDYMLEREQNVQQRLYFINQYLEQVRTTVYRQAMFAEFEKITHAKAEAGEALTANLLENLWLELNRSYYGDGIVMDDAVKIEWARIPHFYRPFYVYQYATGYAAATALAENLRSKDATAQKKYLNYLQSGGSAYSIDLLKSAGVDMTTAAPLTLTLQKFSSRLAELKNFSRKA